MPSIPLRSVSSSRSATVAFEENGDESSAYESTASSPQNAPHKRVRLSNGRASLSPAPVQRDFHRARKDVRSRGDGGAHTSRHYGEDEFQPGSIVRVKLENFVTYAAVEFFPGPSLNMVIGPNGTGKSTLVCAICLGLGWETKHLGRAKDVEEFVKHGADEADIEIELAGNPEDEINPVIRRHIKRVGGKTTWYLNGKHTTHKEIKARTQAFSIQIDNLCQFLPQDKVSEFAGLTPVELLNSTQRAVAQPYMLEYHENLKALRREQKAVQEQEATDKENLASLETRQEQLREEVQRVQERTEIAHRIGLLEMARPLVEYRGIRKSYEEAKVEKRAGRAALKDLEREVEPSLQALKSKQAYREKIATAIKERDRAVARQDKVVKDHAQKQVDFEDKINDLQGQSRSEIAKDKTRRDNIGKIENRIKELELLAKERPVAFDAAELNEKIREKGRAKRAFVSEQSEAKDATTRAKQDGTAKQNEIAQAERQLKSLDSQSGQQSTKLKLMSSDSARAWEWIQDHQDQFQHRVFGPPVIECSVADPKYADQIESLFQKNDLLTFTCQSNADFEKLGAVLYDELRLAEITFQVCPGSLENFKAPMPHDQMRQLGFSGWALDLMRGPEPVLAMLCGQSRIHATGVVDGDITDSQYERIKNSPIGSWVTSKQAYTVRRRREYGPEAISTAVRGIKKAQVWTDQPVDPSVKRELQQKIEKWTDEVKLLLQEFQDRKARVHQLESEIHAIQEEESSLVAEKNAKQKALTHWQGIPTRIETEKEKLQACREAGLQVQERLAEYNERTETLTLEQAKAAVKYAAAVKVLEELHTALYEAEIFQIEAASDVDILTTRSRDVQNLLASKNREVKDLENALARLLAEVKEKTEVCKEIMSRANPEQAQFLANIPDEQTIGDLENEIDADRARLELTHEGNPNAVADFDKRETTISKLKHRLERSEAKLADFSFSINEIRSKWEPELDELVSEISAAFSRSFEMIGCAGQVGIYKPEDDFAAWAIQIMVKFREQENMSVLDSQRQSGGERAVSTIFYLMSLQKLTQSPFRVVDEINQGMDPRNERLVHERMVDIACQENSSQYFLITPKLLSGLKYHERMRVMCIASGEYIPKKGQQLDFRRCINKARTIKGAA